MVFEREAQVFANVWEASWVKAPALSGEAHRTDKGLARWLQSGTQTASMEHAPVKWSIVRGDACRPLEQRIQGGPELGKCRRLFRLLP